MSSLPIYRIILGVINLSREFCLEIREARRKAGLSQSELASDIGCKQSALSMFEQGDGTKLNDEAVKKLSELLGVPIPDKKTSNVHTPPPPVPQLRDRGYCPNPMCPSNHAYEVEGQRRYKIGREEADPAYGKYCALCGEVLEHKCPECGARLHEGAICSFCGKPYVA